MKKIGIVANDYKLDKFKTELTAGGFTNFEIKQFSQGISNIFLTVKETEDISVVAKICHSVEMYFKTVCNVAKN